MVSLTAASLQNLTVRVSTVVAQKRASTLAAVVRKKSPLTTTVPGDVCVLKAALTPER